MEHQPRAPLKLRRWTSEDEQMLLNLRDREKKDFTDIAKILNRTTAAAIQHYSVLKQQSEGRFVEWTHAMDEHIINGRRRGLHIKTISVEMKLTAHAVADRWYTLLREKKVPEDVLAIWRRKNDVVFTLEEDEVILRLWIEMEDDEQLVRMVSFRGKSQSDIRERRIELVYGSSPLYQRLLGIGDGGGNAPHALDKALGKPRYGWMT
ncbi:hypothetical protein P153DRAFT_418575 [Dothidotthia symphoricarpi CBS 119687]|uniref:Myb-like domain-containing protein n=1 Tax=Dothidotthia symphoricarpi CBS 119687 TaxID=1392245 RepID=A0A6A6ADB8_9PLEO|nr:uncharacterized protein P153DRAFT_418575 [Dothidotthia symphoricarpi CBS 119687]KAF2129892.1 hypothetical protein P153DRAFT_418575 [Dothidotthia symphoricarpi CBS 119687]